MSRLGHGMLAVAIVAWLAAVSLGAVHPSGPTRVALALLVLGTVTGGPIAGLAIAALGGTGLAAIATLPIKGASDWLFDRIFVSLGGLSLAVGFLWGLTSVREAPAGRAREFLWCLAAGAALGVAWFLTPEYRLTKPGSFDDWDIPAIKFQFWIGCGALWGALAVVIRRGPRSGKLGGLTVGFVAAFLCFPFWPWVDPRWNSGVNPWSLLAPPAWALLGGVGGVMGKAAKQGPLDS